MKCNCEHSRHFDFQVGVDGVATRIDDVHEYMKVEAGEQWAMYVGHVCDDCAATCMTGWLEPHVCSKWCCDEWRDNGSCIHSDHTM
jgi:hypothetical protein